jgi:hypothetical protein
LPDRFKIEVTQQDINLGVRDQSAHCIVATAIGRQIEAATRISVDAQTVRFTLDARRLIFLTPPKVGDYVIAFDAGAFDAIKPIAFELSNPLVAKPAQPRAPRLIVKGEQPVELSDGDAKRSLPSPSAPTRTRVFGRRAFRVNQGTVEDDLAEYDRMRARRRSS